MLWIVLPISDLHRGQTISGQRYSIGSRLTESTRRRSRGPPKPSGDFTLDFLMGEIYADIAVKHAREIKDPAFVWFVMAAIYFKTARGLIVMGATEQGFLNRLARLAYVGSLN
jgi:hypothetical protein